MRLAVLLVVAVACSSHGNPGTDAAAPLSTPAQCEAAFDMAFPRPCAVPADCVLLVHFDCCHEIDIGVSQTGLAAAMAAETTFSACMGPACGGRGCGGVTTAEDGTAPAAGQSIVATCVAGTCTSTVR